MKGSLYPVIEHDFGRASQGIRHYFADVPRCKAPLEEREDVRKREASQRVFLRI